MPSRGSRIRGCLLGGALGDALGAPVEFDSWATIQQRFGPAGITGFSPAYGRVGAITDDTQMTLFTAEGLIRARQRWLDRGIANVPSVINRAYMRWLSTQGHAPPPDPDWIAIETGWLLKQSFLNCRRAPGTTCLSALQAGGGGTVKRPANNSKGCGGVMRVAPIGLVADDAFSLAVQAAALTHGHPSGFLAAGAFAELISHLMTGEPLQSAVQLARDRTNIEPGAAEVTDAIDKAVRVAASGQVPGVNSIEELGEGWVAEEALAISIFCALVAGDVRDGLVLAVNHGGDSDSTGSITGNILGAMFGEENLPRDLLRDLEGRSVIEQLADDLALDKATDWQRYPPN